MGADIADLLYFFIAHITYFGPSAACYMVHPFDNRLGATGVRGSTLYFVIEGEECLECETGLASFGWSFDQ